MFWKLRDVLTFEDSSFRNGLVFEIQWIFFITFNLHCTINLWNDKFFRIAFETFALFFTDKAILYFDFIQDLLLSAGDERGSGLCMMFADTGEAMCLWAVDAGDGLDGFDDHLAEMTGFHIVEVEGDEVNIK